MPPLCKNGIYYEQKAITLAGIGLYGSFLSLCKTFWFLSIVSKNSEYDQEIPQSQTVDKFRKVQVPFRIT